MADHEDSNAVPPANKGLLVAAGVLLAIPCLALIPVGWYSKADPKLGAFPFFFWYQFLWVFLTAAFTVGAYILVNKARPHIPMRVARDNNNGEEPTR